MRNDKTVRLDPKLHAKVKSLAAKTGETRTKPLTMEQYVDKILRTALGGGTR